MPLGLPPTPVSRKGTIRESNFLPAYQDFGGERVSSVKKQPNMNISLELRAGEWVEVRNEEEILSTLDENGCLENLPFMPEMLRYCGKRFLVYKRADKTCDTISEKFVSRRMYNTVHLSDLRCEGDAHGGCDATCLLFWKETWLKRIEDGEVPDKKSMTSRSNAYRCAIENLYKGTKGKTVDPNKNGEIYSCQATELRRATYPLARLDIRQYWWDFKSGNARIEEIVPVLCIGMFNWIFNRRGLGRILYILTGARRYPHVNTSQMLKVKTPFENLDLQPGEIIQVKQMKEIVMTLNDWRNRGLAFDRHGEMLKYCGKKMKVLKRVHKIIDEKTGEMLVFRNPSIILEGAICCGHYSPDRLLCPRSIYPFWREIWLKRVDSG